MGRKKNNNITSKTGSYFKDLFWLPLHHFVHASVTVVCLTALWGPWVHGVTKRFKPTQARARLWEAFKSVVFALSFIHDSASGRNREFFLVLRGFKSRLGFNLGHLDLPLPRCECCGCFFLPVTPPCTLPCPLCSALLPFYQFADCHKGVAFH